MEEFETLRTSVIARRQLQKTVAELLKEARHAERLERREQQRHPFFHPVSIETSGEPRQRLSAFAREISPSGIGLLHNMCLDLGEVELALVRTQGDTLQVRSQILWCRPCGEGWYLSGARFLEVL